MCICSVVQSRKIILLFLILLIFSRQFWDYLTVNSVNGYCLNIVHISSSEPSESNILS